MLCTCRSEQEAALSVNLRLHAAGSAGREKASSEVHVMKYEAQCERGRPVNFPKTLRIKDEEVLQSRSDDGFTLDLNCLHVVKSASNASKMLNLAHYDIF